MRKVILKKSQKYYLLRLSNEINVGTKTAHTYFEDTELVHVLTLPTHFI